MQWTLNHTTSSSFRIEGKRLSKVLIGHWLKKAMATDSRTLAWKIPCTEEPGGLPSMGSHRVGHDWRDLAAVTAPFTKSGNQGSCTTSFLNLSRTMFISFLHFADLYSPHLPICLVSENLKSLFELFCFTPSIELPLVFFSWFRISDYSLTWLLVLHYEVQSLSHVWLFVTPWTTARQAFLSSLSPWVCWNSCPLSQWCHPSISSFVSSFSSCPQSFPASGFFSSESALCNRWPKYWSFSSSPSNKYSVLISFRIDWFDLFAIQGTLKSLLQHPNSKASILPFSAFTLK